MNSKCAEGKFCTCVARKYQKSSKWGSLIRHERSRQVTSVIRLVGVGDEKNDVAYWTFQCFQRVWILHLGPIRALRKSNTLADYSR